MAVLLALSAQLGQNVWRPLVMKLLRKDKPLPGIASRGLRLPSTSYRSHWKTEKEKSQESSKLAVLPRKIVSKKPTISPSEEAFQFREAQRTVESRNPSWDRKGFVTQFGQEAFLIWWRWGPKQEGRGKGRPWAPESWARVSAVRFENYFTPQGFEFSKWIGKLLLLHEAKNSTSSFTSHLFFSEMCCIWSFSCRKHPDSIAVTNRHGTGVCKSHKVHRFKCQSQLMVGEFIERY